MKLSFDNFYPIIPTTIPVICNETAANRISLVWEEPFTEPRKRQTYVLIIKKEIQTYL